MFRKKKKWPAYGFTYPEFLWSRGDKGPGWYGFIFKNFSGWTLEIGPLRQAWDVYVEYDKFQQNKKEKNNGTRRK